MKCCWFKFFYVNKIFVLNYFNLFYLKWELVYVCLFVWGGGGGLWFLFSMFYGSLCFMIFMVWDKLSCCNYVYWWLYYNFRYKYYFMMIFWGEKNKEDWFNDFLIMIFRSLLFLCSYFIEWIFIRVVLSGLFFCDRDIFYESFVVISM